jgi:hypothetical protein
MSYRQPKIIDDKSGLIVPQAMAQGAAILAKGITAFGVEEKKRKAEEKKKAEQDNRQLIAIGNAHAKDSAIFNAGLKDMSESMRNTLIARNERSLNRIDEIKRAQIIDGNASPALSKELGELQQNILEGNSLAKTMIATSGNLDTLLKEYEKMGKTMFYRNGEDGTNERSKAIVLGFGGAPGYDAAMIEEGGKLYAQVTDKQSKKVFKIEASKFQSIADDLIVNAVDIEGQMSTINSQGTFNKDGSLATSLTVAAGKESPLSSRMDGNKTKVFYRDTTLNQLAVDAVKNKSFENALATIEASADDSQLEQITLGKIGISGDKYKTYKNLVSREEKNAMIKESSNEFFDKQLSQKGIINEGGNYIYRKDIQKETVSQGSASKRKEINAIIAGFNQGLPVVEGKYQKIEEAAWLKAFDDTYVISNNKGVAKGSKGKGSLYTPVEHYRKGNKVFVKFTSKKDQESTGSTDYNERNWDITTLAGLTGYIMATENITNSEARAEAKRQLSYKK